MPRTRMSEGGVIAGAGGLPGVIPAQAGIQGHIVWVRCLPLLDSRFRGNDIVALRCPYPKTVAAQLSTRIAIKPQSAADHGFSTQSGCGMPG